MKREMYAYVAMAALLIASAGGVVMASGEVDKRVEEFKAGMEKKGAGHGDEALKESGGHEKVAPAVARKKKKESSGHGASLEKKEHAVAAHHDLVEVSPEAALKLLVDGNRRYVAEKSAGPHRSAKRRVEISKGQHPFAVIVGCSDSRVPPEILFDQGLGDLFVVRTAGNVVDSVALGSIEYAVEHLGAKLIVVLGHERCGAVDATVKGGDAPANIRSVVEAIKPAVEKAKAKGAHGGHGCDLLCGAVKSNVRIVAEKMHSSPILSEFIDDGLLKVVGAYYDLDSGAATLTYRPYL